MNKPRSIEISIPIPCTQKWEEMTPCGNGRFCNYCQKTVIDFTTWSDGELYQFFSKKPKGVCGHYLSTQLDRPIHIPHQPHSQLYRMAVALGLTLLVAAIPEAHAQNKPPLTTQTTASSQAFPDDQPGKLEGTVLDKKREPLVNATVRLYRNSVLKYTAVTDYDGKFLMNALEPGKYDVTITYPGLDTVRMQCAIASGMTARLYWCPAPPPTLEDQRPHMITGGPMELVPTTPVSDLVATTPGVYQTVRGGGIAVTGARSEGTQYIIDTVATPAPKHKKKHRK